MNSTQKLARFSGFIYLIVVLAGIFSLMYVPSQLIVRNNAALTFQNITASESLFRMGIVGGIVCYTAFLFLPVVLYKLLKPVSENMAQLMVLLAVVSVPIYFGNIQHKFTVLSLISGAPYTNGFTVEQIQSQVMLYLDQYSSGMLVISVFSGLWLLPFGYLVYKSGFLPKFLGVLLILGCVGYLINFTGVTLIKDYAAIGIGKFVSLPASLGEIGTCLWLLIVGVKSKT